MSVTTVQGRTVTEGVAVISLPRVSGQSGTGKDFSPSTSCLACQYHSTNAPYSHFIHLLSTLYELIDGQIRRGALRRHEILNLMNSSWGNFIHFRVASTVEGVNLSVNINLYNEYKMLFAKWESQGFLSCLS